MWRGPSLTAALRRTGRRSLLASSQSRPLCRGCAHHLRSSSSARLQHAISSSTLPPLLLAHASPTALILARGLAFSRMPHSLQARHFSSDSRQPGDDKAAGTESPEHSATKPIPQQATSQDSPSTLASETANSPSPPDPVAANSSSTPVTEAQEAAAPDASIPASSATPPPDSKSTTTEAAATPDSAPTTTTAPDSAPAPTTAPARDSTPTSTEDAGAPDAADKPFDPRDFCCMSGCADCVMYGDAVGIPGKAGAVEMDPAMKAFLEMEQRISKLKQ